MGHSMHKREQCAEFYLDSLNAAELRRLRHRWEDNSKINLKEIGCENVDLIYLTQNQVLFCTCQ